MLSDLYLVSVTDEFMQTKLKVTRTFVYNVFSPDGDILCDGYAARSSWTARTVCRVFIQCSSQVRISLFLVFFN